MKPHQHQPVAPQELELKLSLPLADPERLRKQLALVPMLSLCQATYHNLHNVYYDTPDQQLRQQRAVLRLRRVDGDEAPRWLQTFKTGARDTSALSRRGEWESPLDTAALSSQALAATAWSSFDTDGSLFAALVPCFVTSFDRTIWLVHRHDASVVEVALDLGRIESNGRVTPICELELELKAGAPGALFEIAREIAHTVAVLPFGMSKGQRGYALAHDGLGQAYRAQLPELAKAMTAPRMAQQVLRSAFTQFTSNLEGLLRSDNPELAHQARIGWRRFKCARRMFRQLVPLQAADACVPLHHLLASLSELRNLDVARTDTLPGLADAFIAGDAQRARHWQDMITRLTLVCDLQRATVRQALQQTDVGASLLALLQWLENLSAEGLLTPVPGGSLQIWLKHRLQRLNQQMEAASKVADTPAQWHHVRILAKRLRYGSEDLQDVIPHWLAKQGLQHATKLQSGLGASRDMAHIGILVAKLDVDPGLAAFLRGYAAAALRA